MSTTVFNQNWLKPTLDYLISQLPPCLAWLAFTLVGGVMPVWGSMILTLIFNRSIVWTDYVANGEFALYSASIISGSAFLVFRDVRAKPFPYRLWLGLACLVIALVSTLVFAGVFTRGKDDEVSVFNMAIITLALFLLTLFIAVIVMLIDQHITAVDPAEADRNTVNDLGKRLRNRRKSGNGIA
jgi:hypothetical protein